jgi:hypothetical protein
MSNVGCAAERCLREKRRGARRREDGDTKSGRGTIFGDAEDVLRTTVGDWMMTTVGDDEVIMGGLNLELGPKRSEPLGNDR